MYGQSQASFSNSLVVRSRGVSLGHARLPDNTPVQLALTTRFDGSMDLSATDLQKASAYPGYVSSSSVSGSFALYDPAVTYTSGETAGIPINLVNFSADISGNNSSKYDTSKGRYVAEQSTGTNWSLTSDTGNNLSNSTSYSCDGTVQLCGSISSGIAFTGSPLGFNFDTGMLTVQVDTYIGAILNWDASMYVFNQAYGATASSTTDFSHTFGINLTPTTSNVSLQFSQAQIPLSAPTQVPEAPTQALFAAGLIGMFEFTKRRTRKS